MITKKYVKVQNLCVTVNNGNNNSKMWSHGITGAEVPFSFRKMRRSDHIIACHDTFILTRLNLPYALVPPGKVLYIELGCARATRFFAHAKPKIGSRVAK